MPNMNVIRRVILNNAALQPETTAWVNAVVAAGGTVSDVQRKNVDRLILSLKNHGLYSLQDRIWLFASENTQQALIDIVNLATASEVNSPTFTASQGYAGNASSSYINTNYSPAANGLRFTRDDASFSLYCRTNRTTNQNYTYGYYDGASTGNQTAFGLRGTGGDLSFDINQNQFSGAGGANASTLGFWTAVRTGSGATAVYKNGNSTAVATDTDASIALANLNFYVGARNSSGTADLFGNDQIAIVTIGGGMTNAANVAQFQTDLNAYMTALGTSVY